MFKGGKIKQQLYQMKQNEEWIHQFFRENEKHIKLIGSFVIVFPIRCSDFRLGKHFSIDLFIDLTNICG